MAYARRSFLPPRKINIYLTSFPFMLVLHVLLLVHGGFQSEDDGFCEAEDRDQCDTSSTSELKLSPTDSVWASDYTAVQETQEDSERTDSAQSQMEQARTVSGTEGIRKSKWEPYLKRISEALEQYIPCDVIPSPEGPACFLDVIDKDLLSYDSAGGIHFDDIEVARKRGVLYQIVNHKIYRQKDCLFPARCAGVEYFLGRVKDKLPDIEFVVNVHDYPQVPKHGNASIPVFSFSKTEDYRDITYPAWTFWAGGPVLSIYPRGIGRWDLMREKLQSASGKWSWEKKLSVGFFRGSRTSSGRDPLVLLSRRRPDLVDAQYTKNQAWRSLADTLGKEPAPEVSFEEHCKYKYLFNFRGVAASFRLKHLFLCDSLILNVESEWIEFFYPALKAWVHYVPVIADLSDVEDVLQFARENDRIAREISARGKEFIFRHLTMENVEMYWRKLLERYGPLLRYPVILRKDVSEIQA